MAAMVMLLSSARLPCLGLDPFTGQQDSAETDIMALHGNINAGCNAVDQSDYMHWTMCDRVVATGKTNQARCLCCIVTTPGCDATQQFAGGLCRLHMSSCSATC